MEDDDYTIAIIVLVDMKKEREKQNRTDAWWSSSKFHKDVALLTDNLPCLNKFVE
jgi:hypothetical protein